MIQRAVEAMYTESEDNQFLEVTYAAGTRRSSTSRLQLRRHDREHRGQGQEDGDQGLPRARSEGHPREPLLDACIDEFKENEDLPNTTNPDDWARISARRASGSWFIEPWCRARRAPKRVGRSTPWPTRGIPVGILVP